MNNHACTLGLSTLVFLFSAVPYSDAQDGGDGMSIEWMSSIIDNEARKLGGTKLVGEYLKAQFGVDAQVIYALREHKISYGDIGAVLAMAELMPGGINRDNLDEIVSMREGQQTGRRWETIADYMGVDKERFVHRVNAVAFHVPVIEGSHARQVSASR